MFNELKILTVQQAKQISPVTLAFVGDAVYSLYVREKVVTCHDLKPNELQKLTTREVSAHGQSGLLEKIECKFNQDETEVYHRGRNAKKTTKSKNASVAEYNRSTGFEAVLGFLYLTGQRERISYLIEDQK